MKFQSNYPELNRVLNLGTAAAYIYIMVYIYNCLTGRGAAPHRARPQVQGAQGARVLSFVYFRVHNRASQLAWPAAWHVTAGVQMPLLLLLLLLPCGCAASGDAGDTIPCLRRARVRQRSLAPAAGGGLPQLLRVCLRAVVQAKRRLHQLHARGVR